MFMIDAVKSIIFKIRLKRLVSKLELCGKGCEIGLSNSFVFPGRIEIGNYVYIGPSGYLNGRGGLKIADHVVIAPEIAIITSMHRFRDAEMVPYDQVEILKPVFIERCVWVGMRVTILPGVTIGEGSVIGAGSVVTRSCPPGSILGGNPAKIIGHRDATHYQHCVEEGKFYLKMKNENTLNKVEVCL